MMFNKLICHNGIDAGIVGLVAVAPRRSAFPTGLYANWTPRCDTIFRNLPQTTLRRNQMPGHIMQSPPQAV